MTVELIFKGDVPASMIDEALLPPDGGHNIGASADSPGLNRHDVTIVGGGEVTKVQIDGPGLSEMSSNTLQSIKDTVPTEHITTREV